MPETEVYTILRRATSPEDETLWREVATITASHAANAIDLFMRAEEAAGDLIQGQYLVVLVGAYSCKRYDVTARTEYDVQEPEREQTRAAA